MVSAASILGPLQSTLVLPCTHCLLLVKAAVEKHHEPAGAGTDVQEIWSAANCGFLTLSGWCMAGEAVGDR